MSVDGALAVNRVFSPSAILWSVADPRTTVAVVTSGADTDSVVVTSGAGTDSVVAGTVVSSVVPRLCR